MIVLVSLNARHHQILGEAEQKNLVGPGSVDSKFVADFADPDSWSFEKAKQHCGEALASFSKISPHNRDSVDPYVDDFAEFITGAELGPAAIGLNNQIGVAVQFGKEIWRDLLKKTQTDRAVFETVYAIGLKCLRDRTIDLQPTDFRDWFYDVVAGNCRPPGPKSNAWTKLPRDVLVYRLSTTLVRNGLSQYRAPDSPAVSACDAIANAAVEHRVFGIKSYSSVRRIIEDISSGRRTGMAIFLPKVEP